MIFNWEGIVVNSLTSCIAAALGGLTQRKNVEKCKEFYMKMSTTHNRCQTSTTLQIQEYPEKEQHLKNFQDKLQVDEESIQKVESINEEVIGTWVAQALVHKHILDEWLIQTRPMVKEIESQLAKHKLTARILELVDY